jgi:hypothetical protein
VISCNNTYVGKGIVALKNFKSHHPNADMYIIGTKFSQKSHELAAEHEVKLIEVDLSNDIIRFNERPYNRAYPIECFYHFYSHVCLSDYDYIVTTEPDIYFNKAIDSWMFRSVDYIGASYHKSHLNRKYRPIMKDIDKFRKALGPKKVTGYRPLGGVRIYNVKGLNKINLYNQIVDVYQKCWEIGRPICGDDSTLQLYQIYHPDHVKTISTDLMIVFHSFGLEHVDKVYSFHFGGPNRKYWDKESAKTEVEGYFRNKMIEFIEANFTKEFIREHLPNLGVRPN